MSRVVIAVPNDVVLRGELAILDYVETRLTAQLQDDLPGTVGPEITVLIDSDAAKRMVQAEAKRTLA